MAAFLLSLPIVAPSVSWQPLEAVGVSCPLPLPSVSLPRPKHILVPSLQTGVQLSACSHTHTHPSLCWKCSWLPELLLAEGPVFRYNPLIAACVLGAGLLRKPGFRSPSPLGVRVGVSGSPLTPLPSFLLLHAAPQPWESDGLKQCRLGHSASCSQARLWHSCQRGPLCRHGQPR